MSLSRIQSGVDSISSLGNGTRTITVRDMKERMLNSSIKLDTARASQNIYQNVKSTAQQSYRVPSPPENVKAPAGKPEKNFTSLAKHDKINKVSRAASQYTDRSTFKEYMLKDGKKNR